MYNSDTELLFPSRLIPTLRDLRGTGWESLVDRVSTASEADTDHIAFVLLMVRLNGCATCFADSYKAMRGCTQCARQSVRRYRGSDEDLNQLFHDSRVEVDDYLSQSP
jgi:hypothetical protein